jgi:hypothetical protein
MKNEYRNGVVPARYDGMRSGVFRPQCAFYKKPTVLPLTELNLAKLLNLPLLPNNGFLATLRFTNWLLEKLVLLNYRNITRLLNLAVEAA